MVCEQQTSKGPESQSPSSLSWQSPHWEQERGAANPNPGCSSAQGREQELCPG